MSDETSPTPFPSLMRRFIPEPSNAISAAAFRPTNEDTDGISVSFEDLPNPIQRVLADIRKPPECYSVCRFNLQGLSELTVEASPTPLDPGHATIPQICPPYDKLKKNHERKILIKSWLVELAFRAETIHHAGDPIESI